MRFKHYLLIAVLVYGLIAGVRLGSPYVRNMMFSHEMDSQANLMKFGTAIRARNRRSEEHTSELQSHSFISYAVFCLKKKKNIST